MERGSGRVRLEAEYYQFQGLWPGWREGPDDPKCDDDISNNTHWVHLYYLDLCGQDYSGHDSFEELENVDSDENDEDRLIIERINQFGVYGEK